MDLFEIADKCLPCSILDENNIFWKKINGTWIGKLSIQNKDFSSSWINGDNKLKIKFKNK